MPIMWRIIAFCSVLQVTSVIVLRETSNQNQKVYTMECLADVDITVSYKNQWSNSEISVVRCEVLLNACYLVHPTMGDLYSASKTLQGGRLYIKDDIGTRGQYRCCATFNISECDTVEIGFLAKSTTQLNSDQKTDVDKTSQAPPSTESKNDANIVAIVAIVAPAIVMIVLIVTIGCLLQHWFKHSQQRKEDEKHNDDKRSTTPLPNPMQAEEERSLMMETKQDKNNTESAVIETVKETDQKMTSDVISKMFTSKQEEIDGVTWARGDTPTSKDLCSTRIENYRENDSKTWGIGDTRTPKEVEFQDSVEVDRKMTWEEDANQKKVCVTLQNILTHTGIEIEEDRLEEGSLLITPTTVSYDIAPDSRVF